MSETQGALQGAEEENLDQEPLEQEQPLQDAENAPESEPEPQKPWNDQDESFARGYGWVPKEEWRGPASQWAPADQFANKIRTRVSTVEKQEKRIQDLEAQLSERSERMSAEVQRVRQMIEAGHQRQIEELQGQLREAASESDIQRFDAINKRIEAVRKQHSDASATAEPKQTAQPQQPQEAPEVSAFKQANADWYGRAGQDNIQATLRANRLSGELGAAGYDAATQLSVITETIGREFGLGPMGHLKPAPKPQQKPAAPAHQAVDGGSNSHAKQLVAGKSRKKTFSDLPEAAREEFKICVQRGYYTNDDAGRQKAADAYFREM